MLDQDEYVNDLSGCCTALAKLAFVACIAVAVLALAATCLADPNVEKSKAASAVALSLPLAGAPAPDNPAPAPSPESDACENCYGTGRSGDGITQCQVCGGTGKKSGAELVKRIEKLTSDLATQKLYTFKVLDLAERSVAIQERAPSSPAATGLSRVSEPLVTDFQPSPVASITRKVPAVPQTKWLNNATLARQEAARTGKPVFMFFTGKHCQPCEALKKIQFADPRSRELFAECVCCLNDTATWKPEDLAPWRVPPIPQAFVIRSDWSTFYVLELFDFGQLADTETFVARLEDAIKTQVIPSK